MASMEDSNDFRASLKNDDIFFSRIPFNGSKFVVFPWIDFSLLTNRTPTNPQALFFDGSYT